MRHATVVAGSCHPNSYSIKEAAALLQFSLVMKFSPAAAFQPIGYCCASQQTSLTFAQKDYKLNYNCTC